MTDAAQTIAARDASEQAYDLRREAVATARLQPNDRVAHVVDVLRSRRRPAVEP